MVINFHELSVSTIIPKRSVSCLFFTAALAGCSSSPVVQPDLPDSLTAMIYNDSTGTMLMKGAMLQTFADARCEGEQLAAQRIAMGDQEVLATIPVPPGRPFTFALSTTNAQSFKGNWGCSVTSTFTPIAGARYTATLQSADDNRVCSVTIRDQNAAIIPATRPDYSCNKTYGRINKNGAGWVAPKQTIYIVTP